MENGQLSPEALRSLAAFLPRFEQADFRHGEWFQPESTEPGVLTLPFFSHSDVVREFVQMAYDHGLVLGDFGWPAWVQTPEAKRLRDDPDALAAATPVQLARLLTVVIRQDRFCEGSLAAAFESGLIPAICRQAAALVAGVEGGQHDR